jgi:hypothetical protein
MRDPTLDDDFDVNADPSDVTVKIIKVFVTLCCSRV